MKQGIKVWYNGHFSQFEAYIHWRITQQKLALERCEDADCCAEGEISSCLFFDNVFTNEHLLQDLLADDIYTCGTARKDRKGAGYNHLATQNINQNLRLYTFIKYALALLPGLAHSLLAVQNFHRRLGLIHHIMRAHVTLQTGLTHYLSRRVVCGCIHLDGQKGGDGDGE